MNNITVTIGGLANPLNSTDSPNYGIALTAVEGSVQKTDVETKAPVIPATFSKSALIENRIGANRVSLTLQSTGSGNARCVVVGANSTDPDPSDIIDAHGYGNTLSISNTSLEYISANVATVFTIPNLETLTAYKVFCTQSFTKSSDYPTFSAGLNFTTAASNSVVLATAKIASTTTTITLRTVFATAGIARCVLVVDGSTAPANESVVLQGGAGLDVVGTPPDSVVAESGAYFDVVYKVGVLSVATEYDVYCAQANSGVSNATGSSVVVTPGIFSNDSIAFSEPSQGMETVVTYAFTYDYAIAVAEKIGLTLPGFSTSSSVTASPCGGTNWTASTSSLGGNFVVSLTAAQADLPANTPCSIQLTNVITPSNTGTPSITQSANATAGKVGTDAVTTVPSIIAQGSISQDAITFNDTMPGATAVIMTYNFTYSVAITANDQIELGFPATWNTSDPVVESSACNTSTGWTVTRVAYTLVLVSHGTLSSGTECTIHIGGWTSLPPTQENHPEFVHRFTAAAGSMKSRAVSETQAITAIRSLTFKDQNDGSLNLAFVPGKLNGQEFVVPSATSSLRVMAVFDGALTVQARTSGNSFVPLNSSELKINPANLELGTTNQNNNEFILEVTGGHADETYKIQFVRSVVQSISVRQNSDEIPFDAFVSGQTSGQTLLVPSSFAKIQVRVVNTGSAQFQINLDTSVSYTSGSYTGDYDLEYGSNSFNITATATKNEGQYTITVVRAAVTNLRLLDSVNNSLAQTVDFKSGELQGTPAVSVPYYVTSLQLNASFELGSVEGTTNDNLYVSLISGSFVADSTNFALDFGSGNNIKLKSSVDGEYKVPVNRGVLKSTSVTPDSLAPGTTNNVAVNFTSTNAIPTDGKIIVGFPTGFDLPENVTATSQTIDGGFTVSKAGQIVTVERTGSGIETAPGTISLVFEQVKNPATAGGTGPFAINTTTQDNAVIGTDPDVIEVTIGGSSSSPSPSGSNSTSSSSSPSPSG